MGTEIKAAAIAAAAIAAALGRSPGGAIADAVGHRRHTPGVPKDTG
jgi:nitrate/nitrite transporter NarK